MSNKFPTCPVKIPSCDALLISPSELSRFSQVGIAVGGLSFDEIKFCVNRFSQVENLSLFYGFQAFPTSLSDINEPKLSKIIDTFALPIIYADHTDSNHTTSIVQTINHILGLGCSGLERHICLDKGDKYDTVSASVPPEFADIKKHIDTMPLNISRKHDLKFTQDLSPSEQKYRSMMQKKAIISSPIYQNNKIDHNSVTFKRASTSNGILSFEYEALLKNSSHIPRANKNLSPNHLLSHEDIVL